MRINFFYKDALSQGGAPADFFSLFNSFPPNFRGNLYCFSEHFSLHGDDNSVVPATGLIAIIKIIFRDRKILRSNINVLIGGMIWQNSIIALVFHVLGVDYDLLPFSQMAQYAVANKIFMANPIIREGALELGNKSNFSPSAKVFLKKLYFYTAGIFMLKGAESIWTASEFERNDLCCIFNGISGKRWIFYSMGLNSVLGRSKDYSYSEYVTSTNLVYWGRVDYFHKGLDRLVNAVAYDADFFRRTTVLFHILGPSYNGGKKTLVEQIKQLGIADLFVIPSDADIKAIDLGGLTNADGAIFLTRWEGHPRVIREALFFGVPALITPECHFGDRHYAAISITGGVCIENADNIILTQRVLKEFINRLKSENTSLSFSEKDHDNAEINSAIDWNTISREIITQLETTPKTSQQ